jgi:transposase
MRFRPYSPDQAAALPPSVRDVRGPDHLCFFLRRVVARLDLSALKRAYGEEGQPGYHPALLLAVWLYAYALGITRSHRLEPRLREDLAFRYLAGGAQPDSWALNDFRRRHPKALNDLFTQGLEWARAAGLGRWGHGAIDSTRVKANASPDRVDSRRKLRSARARLPCQIRRWQQACNADDPNEAPGLALTPPQGARLEAQWAELPRRLKELQKSGLKRRSRTDPDSRFLHQRGKFLLGYPATLASSEDHLIVEQRRGQNSTASETRRPVVEAVVQRCGERPRQLSADSGFFTLPNLPALEAQGIDVYMPDAVLAQELNTGRPLKGAAPVRDPAHRRLRRKATIEPILGVLKEQRALRSFRLRGLVKAGIELTLACTAYNLTHLWRRAPHCAP